MAGGAAAENAPGDAPGADVPADVEDIGAVFGPDTGAGSSVLAGALRRSFQPWHHPVKQLVRADQWAALTTRLVKDHLLETWAGTRERVLRYFTLPGADMLDVRVLADALAAVTAPGGAAIEYFGFDSSAAAQQSGPLTGGPLDATAPEFARTAAEAALRQAGRVTDNSEVVPANLESIVSPRSHTRARLLRQPPFDVINIDACNHLTHAPPGRGATAFDALQVLLEHQMDARRPWLLFVTTRVAPDLLGAAGNDMRAAIADNLRVAGPAFADALAEALAVPPSDLDAALDRAWGAHDERFIKLYAIGLGKVLLRFYHGQLNRPAAVELASTFAYRVGGGAAPDMLAMAFRITPGARRVLPGTAGGTTVLTPNLEPERACRIARRAAKLRDLDRDLETDAAKRRRAVEGTVALLSAVHYDVAAWRDWVSRHQLRPVAAGGAGERG